MMDWDAEQWAEEDAEAEREMMIEAEQEMIEDLYWDDVEEYMLNPEEISDEQDKNAAAEAYNVIENARKSEANNSRTLAQARAVLTDIRGRRGFFPKGGKSGKDGKKGKTPGKFGKFYKGKGNKGPCALCGKPH